MTAKPNPAVQVVRTAEGRYLAMNRNGVEIELGRADDLFTPVELLLAAVAGCAAIDLDGPTSRRSEPEVFKVGVEAERSTSGGNRLENIEVNFSLRFPDTEAGRQATSMVERVLKLSHDKLCTVSRSLELGTPVAVSHTFSHPLQEPDRDGA